LVVAAKTPSFAMLVNCLYLSGRSVAASVRHWGNSNAYAIRPKSRKKMEMDSKSLQIN